MQRCPRSWGTGYLLLLTTLLRATATTAQGYSIVRSRTTTLLSRRSAVVSNLTTSSADRIIRQASSTTLFSSDIRNLSLSPRDVTSTSSNGSERTLGIILAVTLCSIAIGLLLVILACTFGCRPRDKRMTLTLTSLTPEGRPASKLLQRTSRDPKPIEMQSSIWSHPPRTNPLRLSTLQANDSTLAGLTADRVHSGSIYSVHSAVPPPLQLRSYDTSLSPGHARSTDLVNAASGLPHPPAMHHASQGGPSMYQYENHTPPVGRDFNQSQCPEQTISNGIAPSPLVPGKNPHRRPGLLAHNPSWTEVLNFNFSNVESQQKRDRRQGWIAGDDRRDGRYELD